MARYYEVNALIEFIKQHTPTINGETTMECVERAIREAPTADVVPKSEVVTIVAQITAHEMDSYEHIYKQEVAREIFEEIDSIFRKYYEICSQTDLKLLEPILQGERFIINEMWHEVAELKNKYTESEGKG